MEPIRTSGLDGTLILRALQGVTSGGGGGVHLMLHQLDAFSVPIAATLTGL
jgi:hypothetical protein